MSWFATCNITSPGKALFKIYIPRLFLPLIAESNVKDDITLRWIETEVHDSIRRINDLVADIIPYDLSGIFITLIHEAQNASPETLDLCIAISVNITVPATIDWSEGKATDWPERKLENE